jgi:hypothetical protein
MNAQGGAVDPVRIFVAATAAEWLPMRVLEFSIRETSSLAVNFSSIHQFERPIPIPQAVKNRPRTPFSFQRFLIPELCHYKGRALYLDADMQVFRDIGELWNRPFLGCDLQTVRESNDGRRGQFSVMLLNCERLDWNIDEIVRKLDEGTLGYSGLMYEMKVVSKIGLDIPPEWNSLERYVPDSTALLHYTDMNMQPWTSTGNPYGHLWIRCLRRALSGGVVTRADLEREAASGNIRPSLISQIDHGIDSCVGLPHTLADQDRNYTPPYKQLRSGRARPWTSLRAAAWQILARCYRRSPFTRWF